MKIHSFLFVEPFVVRPGALFYYDFSGWVNLVEDVTFGTIGDAHVVVFGYIETTTHGGFSENTIIFTAGKFCVVPYVYISSQGSQIGTR